TPQAADDLIIAPAGGVNAVLTYLDYGGFSVPSINSLTIDQGSSLAPYRDGFAYETFYTNINSLVVGNQSTASMTVAGAGNYINQITLGSGITGAGTLIFDSSFKPTDPNYGGPQTV